MDELLNRYPRWMPVVPFLTALAIGIFYLRVIGHFEYTPDDTYIYLRTAVNVVGGEGWSFNPGSDSYSVTGPLWALLITGGTAMGLDPYIVAKSMDATLAALSILALQLLVFSLTEDRVLSAAAAIIMTFDASILRWAGSGMETSLAILLTVLVFRYVIEEEWLIAGAALGFLMLVRPEYALLAPWLVIGTANVPWRQHVRRWLVPLVVAGVIALAWWVVAVLWTGTWLPTTIASKAGWWFIPDRMMTAVWESLRVIAATHATPILVVAILAFAIRRGAEDHRWRHWRLLLGWPLILSLAYAMQGVQVISRYLVPALTMLTAGMMLTLSMWLAGRPWLLRRASLVTLTAGLLTIVVNTAVYEVWVAPHVRDFTLGMQQAVKPIAFWLRNNAAPSDEILTPDIGMVGYISERRVWDTPGLATPDLRLRMGDRSYDEVMEQRLYRTLVNPRFIIDRSRTRERLADSTLRPIMTAEMPGLGVNIPGPQYVTLYEAVR